MLVKIEVGLQKSCASKIIQKAEQILNVDIIVAIKVSRTTTIELLQTQDDSIAVVVHAHQRWRCTWINGSVEVVAILPRL